MAGGRSDPGTAVRYQSDASPPPALGFALGVQPAMLATLVVISSLFQRTLSRRLALLRRILTPTVAGTVIILIAVTVMPTVSGMLGQLPQASPAAAPLGTLVTLALIVAIGLKARGTLRLWAPDRRGDRLGDDAPQTQTAEDLGAERLPMAFLPQPIGDRLPGEGWPRSGLCRRFSPEGTASCASIRLPSAGRSMMSHSRVAKAPCASGPLAACPVLAQPKIPIDER